MKRLLLFAGIACLVATTSRAQVAGEIENVTFQRMEKPILSSTGGAPMDFIHSNYANAAWGDYNNDGYLDLFYSDKNNHGSATRIASNLYLNNGDGTFVKPTSPFTGVAFSCPVWFDMNNDGLLDLFLPGLGNLSYQWNNLSTNLSNISARLYINQGEQDNGTYTFKEIPVTESGLIPLYNGKSGGKGHNWAVAGDYDNDGYTDLLVTGFDEAARIEKEEYWDAERVVYLFKNIKGKYFELQKTPLDGDKPFHGLTDGSVCFADLDNDGWLDIVSTGYGNTRESEIHLYWNQQDGTFTESDFSFNTTCNSSCDVYDLNNDGLTDLVLTGVYFNTNQKQFHIYKNKGNRDFEKVESEQLLPIDGGQLSFGDINHDGLPDMLVGGHNNTHQHTTWLYVNKGEFQFEPIAWYNKEEYGWAFSRITHGNQHLIDFNDDGKLDAWMSGWSAEYCSSGCNTELWENRSDVTANEAPAPPRNLQATLLEGTDIISFSWDAATDDVTPQAALRYNFYIKGKDTEKYYSTVPVDINTGFVKVGRPTGLIGQCSYQFRIEADGEYEWGVQAIDNGQKGGVFAKANLTVDGAVISNVNYETENSISLYAKGHSLYYSVTEPGEIVVYGVNGGIVYQNNIMGAGDIAIPNTGIYLVKVKTASAVKRVKVGV